MALEELLQEQPQLPRFTGSNPALWISQVEQYFLFYAIFDEERFPFVIESFDDEPFWWFNGWYRSDFITWNDFTTAMVTQFHANDPIAIETCRIRQSKDAVDLIKEPALVSSKSDATSVVASLTTSDSIRSISFPFVTTAHKVFDKMPGSIGQEIDAKVHDIINVEELESQTEPQADVNGVKDAKIDILDSPFVLHSVVAESSLRHGEKIWLLVEALRVLTSFGWKSGLLCYSGGHWEGLDKEFNDGEIFWPLMVISIFHVVPTLTIGAEQRLDTDSTVITFFEWKPGWHFGSFLLFVPGKMSASYAMARDWLLVLINDAYLYVDNVNMPIYWQPLNYSGAELTILHELSTQGYRVGHILLLLDLITPMVINLDVALAPTMVMHDGFVFKLNELVYDIRKQRHLVFLQVDYHIWMIPWLSVVSIVKIHHVVVIKSFGTVVHKLNEDRAAKLSYHFANTSYDDHRLIVNIVLNSWWLKFVRDVWSLKMVTWENKIKNVTTFKSPQFHYCVSDTTLSKVSWAYRFSACAKRLLSSFFLMISWCQNFNDIIIFALHPIKLRSIGGVVHKKGFKFMIHAVKLAIPPTELAHGSCLRHSIKSFLLHGDISATKLDFSQLFNDEFDTELREKVVVSMRTKPKAIDVISIKGISVQVLSLSEYTARLLDNLKSKMYTIAPKLTILVGKLGSRYSFWRAYHLLGDLVHINTVKGVGYFIPNAQKLLFLSMLLQFGDIYAFVGPLPNETTPTLNSKETKVAGLEGDCFQSIVGIVCDTGGVVTAQKVLVYLWHQWQNKVVAINRRKRYKEFAPKVRPLVPLVPELTTFEALYGHQPPNRACSGETISYLKVSMLKWFKCMTDNLHKIVKIFNCHISQQRIAYEMSKSQSQDDSWLESYWSWDIDTLGFLTFDPEFSVDPSSPFDFSNVKRAFHAFSKTEHGSLLVHVILPFAALYEHKPRELAPPVHVYLACVTLEVPLLELVTVATLLNISLPSLWARMNAKR